MTIEQAAFVNKLEQVVLFAEVTERFTGQPVELTDKARWLLAYKKDPERTVILLEKEYNRVLSQFVELFPRREYLKGDRGSDGRDGKDGKRGSDGRDGRDAPSMNEIRAELIKLVSELPKPKDGQDGKDAVLSSESLQEAILEASRQLDAPDVSTAITADPEAVRNALELLIGDERLSWEAVQGLPELIDEVEKLKFTTQRVVGGGVSKNTVESMISDAVSATGSLSFETVSQNLSAYPSSINYSGSDISSIDYTTESGTITKTLNYTDDNVTSIVLSGDLPAGLSDTTKTISYSGNDVSGVSYS